ncbi:pilus assembly protein FimV [Luteibacter sp. Sphag1AF]|uniref:FimV/HubP family polar landmark protein n=1 Tax=Luteibacter sp. Sphag1AF TaxID=2587031 RepID=UPI001608B4EB|nr:FimV/HubP family polar landmark protein [Luteibacter sp. Sphag1AF]MBB3229006.1 pilus assembly protein FimV [Luteibacter sp. Sphag1AF]
MNRSLKLSIMLALAVGTGQVLAQNLGQVQVKSTVDQPLLAEIPLSGVSGDNIHVTLASEDAFSQAGINRKGLPVELQFVVSRNAQGQSVIRVTSAEPVRDTYLDFLVEVNAGGSKVVREVTMLLDPPRFGGAAPASSAAGVPSRTSPVPSRSSSPTTESSAPAPSRTSSFAGAPTQPVSHHTPASGTIGPVQRGQTLSTIAREAAGGSDMNRMLVALQKANPDAFYRDNMNALKTGVVLRVPSPEDVQALTAAAALAEVRRQNEDWRGGSARAPSAVADAAATGQAAPAASGKKSPSDRLALAPAAEGGDSASTRAGTAGGKGDAAVAGLKQQLATTQESLASMKQQGAELKSRIGDLEEINQKNTRLLSLKDSEIAELQRKLAEAHKAAGQPAEPVAAATTPVAAAPAAAATSPAAAAPAASTPAASASVAAVPAPGATVAITPIKDAAPAASAPKPPVATPSTPHITPVAPTAAPEWYMQPLVWGAGGIVILLGLLAAVFGRRKKPVAAVSNSSLADRFGDEQAFDSFGHTDELDKDQRELLDALAEHPDDVGLHLELVSLYYGRRDVDHFEAAAEAMYAHVADPEQAEWQEVVTMGEDLVPSHPLFGGTGQSPDEDEDGHQAAALEEFDLGSYVVTPQEPERPSATTPLKHSEYHFNFDLTPQQRADAETHATAPDVFAVNAEESPYIEPLYVDPQPHHDDAPLSAFDDVLPPETVHHLPVSDTPAPAVEPELPSTWKFDEPEFGEEPVYAADTENEGFSDDPVDTKLDLARAYLDMGDADGARAMLDEVIVEGSQMQKDTARRLLSDIG